MPKTLSLHYTIGRTGLPLDISWPFSPIETVSCTACVLSHRTRGPMDLSWPSSHKGTVRCTARVLSEMMEEKEAEEEGEGEGAGPRNIKQPPH